MPVWSCGPSAVWLCRGRVSCGRCPVAVGASVVPLVGAALSLAAFTPGRLPLPRTVAVQLASSYAGVVLHPSVGQLAVGARYLSRLGHSRAVTAATVGLTQLSSLAVTLVLLAAALAVTGTALVLPGWLTTAALVVAAGTGVRQFVLERSTLEDLFVTLTGEGFDVRA